MKRILAYLLLLPALGYSQNKAEAEKKVDEGVLLHDERKYNEALVKYEEALRLDQNNLLALSEKALTLNTSKQYEKAIETAKLALRSHANEDVKNVYVTYGNALDYLNEIENSIKIYDEGIAKYPDYYQLHFNKGITLVNAKQTEKSILSFQDATKINPTHPGSFNALALLSKQNRIASILAYSRYLTLDNKSARAHTNLEELNKLMLLGVTKTGDNSISLVLNSEMLDTNEKGKNIENNFSTTDMILSMAAALDYDEKNKNKTNCEKFINKFEAVCASLKESQKGEKGYYWEFLAPYFIEMGKEKLIEPFTYILFLPTKSDDVVKYHEEHSDKIQQFYNWSKNYKWK